MMSARAEATRHHAAGAVGGDDGPGAGAGVRRNLLSSCVCLLITGSSASAYDVDPWINFLKDVVVQCYEARIRVIGICFGHQLVAQALGGRVVKNTRGHEGGVARWTLTLPALSYLKSLVPAASRATRGAAGSAAEQLSLFCWHGDCVEALPRPQNGFLHGGGNSNTEEQFFFEQGRVLCFQSHPEFSTDMVAAIARRRFSERPKRLRDVLRDLKKHAEVARRDSEFVRDALYFFAIGSPDPDAHPGDGVSAQPASMMSVPDNGSVRGSGTRGDTGGGTATESTKAHGYHDGDEPEQARYGSVRSQQSQRRRPSAATTGTDGTGGRGSSIDDGSGDDSHGAPPPRIPARNALAASSAGARRERGIAQLADTVVAHLETMCTAVEHHGGRREDDGTWNKVKLDACRKRLAGLTDTRRDMALMDELTSLELEVRLSRRSVARQRGPNAKLLAGDDEDAPGSGEDDADGDPDWPFHTTKETLSGVEKQLDAQLLAAASDIKAQGMESNVSLLTAYFELLKKGRGGTLGVSSFAVSVVFFLMVVAVVERVVEMLGVVGWVMPSSGPGNVSSV